MPTAVNSSLIRGVLFDLDGTLVDTAPDLAAALNHTLRTQGRSELPFAEIRPHVSHGSGALIECGFSIKEELEPDRFDELRQILLDFYLQNIASHSLLFAGMESLLEKLEANDTPWGVVTNKPAYLTDPLMQALGLDRRSKVTVSGDTLKQRKPDPAPLHLACERLGLKPHSVLYIGDAERDIIAGRRAGMATMIAEYGYIEDHAELDSWQADSRIAHAAEIFAWIEEYNRRQSVI